MALKIYRDLSTLGISSHDISKKSVNLLFILKKKKQKSKFRFVHAS